MKVLPFLPRLPEKLLTDNGPEFRASLFNEVLNRYGIKHVCSTPYKPSSNGAVERINRTIGTFLASLTSEPCRWDEYLPKAIITYNSKLHKELGVSPAEYLLARKHQVTSVPALPQDIKDVWKLGHPRFSPYVVGER